MGLFDTIDPAVTPTPAPQPVPEPAPVGVSGGLFDSVDPSPDEANADRLAEQVHARLSMARQAEASYWAAPGPKEPGAAPTPDDVFQLRQAFGPDPSFDLIRDRLRREKGLPGILPQRGLGTSALREFVKASQSAVQGIIPDEAGQSLRQNVADMTDYEQNAYAPATLGEEIVGGAAGSIPAIVEAAAAARTGKAAGAGKLPGLNRLSPQALNRLLVAGGAGESQLRSNLDQNMAPGQATSDALIEALATFIGGKSGIEASKIFFGGAKAGVKEAVKDVAKEAIEEGATSVAQNVNQQAWTDPSKILSPEGLAQTGRQGIIGAGAGSLAAGAVRAASDIPSALHDVLLSKALQDEVPGGSGSVASGENARRLAELGGSPPGPESPTGIFDSVDPASSGAAPVEQIPVPTQVEPTPDAPAPVDPNPVVGKGDTFQGIPVPGIGTTDVPPPSPTEQAIPGSDSGIEIPVPPADPNEPVKEPSTATPAVKVSGQKFYSKGDNVQITATGLAGTVLTAPKGGKVQIKFDDGTKGWYPAEDLSATESKTDIRDSRITNVPSEPPLMGPTPVVHKTGDRVKITTTQLEGYVSAGPRADGKIQIRHNEHISGWYPPEVIEPVAGSPLEREIDKPQPIPPKPAAAPVKKPKYKARLFQGRGATPEQIYGKENVERGFTFPILGPAKYFATNAKEAGYYGTVSEHDVELHNPYVIDSDKKWFEILRQSGAEALNSGNGARYEPDGVERVRKATIKLNRKLRAMGHDGVIVKLDPHSDDTKRMYEAFDHDQTIVFDKPDLGNSGKVADTLPDEENSLAPKSSVPEADTLQRSRVSGTVPNILNIDPNDSEDAGREAPAEVPDTEDTAPETEDGATTEEENTPDDEETYANALGRAGTSAAFGVPATLAKPRSKKTKTNVHSRAAIQDYFEKLLNISVRSGRAMRGALGHFARGPQAIRLRMAKNLNTLVHEIGHFLDNKFDLGGMQNTAPANVMAEITQLGLDHFAGKNISSVGKPLARIRAEGVADAVRYWIDDEAKLVAKAPNFFKYFEAMLKRQKLYDGFVEGRKRYLSNKLATPEDRIDAAIEWNSRPPRSSVWGWIVRLRRNWVDDLDVLRQAVMAMNGGKLPENVAENAYLMARLSRGSSGIAMSFINNKVTLENGKVVGIGFREVLEGIPRDQIENFQKYAVSLRVIELARHGKTEVITAKDAKHYVAQVKAGPNADLFAGAMEKLQKFHDGLLHYAVASGLKTQDEANRMKADNLLYIPFKKAFDPGESPYTTSTSPGGAIAQKEGPYKRKGDESGENIQNPLANVIGNTFELVSAVEKHRAMKALVRLYDEKTKPANFGEGNPIGKWMEEVKAKTIVTKLKGQTAIDFFEKNGVDLVEQNPGDLDILAEKMILEFHSDKTKAREKGYIRVLTGGRVRYFQLDTELYDTLMNIDPSGIAASIPIAEKFASIFRAGATTLNPDFILKNLVRDTLTAAIQGSGANPFGIGKSFMSVLTKDESWWKFMRSGAYGATWNAQAFDQKLKTLEGILPKESLTEVVKDPMSLIKILSKLHGGVAAFGDVIENLNRLSEFRRVYNLEKSKSATEQQAVRTAGLAARNVTVDFSRAGYSARNVNRYVPFFNAGIQGTSAMIRAMKEHPFRTSAFLATYCLLPSLVEFLLTKDDDDYEEQPAYIRDTFWLIPTPPGSKDPFFKIPKPPGWSVVASGFGRGLRSLYTNDRSAWEDYAKNAAEQVDPTGLSSIVADHKTPGAALIQKWVPTIMLPVVEVMANYDFFRGRNIVPYFDSQKIDKYEYSTHTSETAKAIGKLMDVSPMKVDHMIEGYTAGLGRLAVAGVDATFSEKKLDSRPAKWPVVRAFIANNPGAAAESVRRFYDKYNEAEELSRTLNDRAKRGDKAEIRKLLDEHQDLLHEGWLRKTATGSAGIGKNGETARQLLATGRTRIKAIDENKSITAEERRRQLDDLYERMVKISRAALRLPTGPDDTEP